MNINFDSATYNALLNRAKAEGKSIPKLVDLPPRLDTTLS